jgi:hypothetical protein
MDLVVAEPLLDEEAAFSRSGPTHPPSGNRVIHPAAQNSVLKGCIGIWYKDIFMQP